jgi:hypothetical protein
MTEQGGRHCSPQRRKMPSPVPFSPAIRPAPHHYSEEVLSPEPSHGPRLSLQRGSNTQKPLRRHHPVAVRSNLSSCRSPAARLGHRVAASRVSISSRYLLSSPVGTCSTMTSARNRSIATIPLISVMVVVVVVMRGRLIFLNMCEPSIISSTKIYMGRLTFTDSRVFKQTW